MRSRESRHAGRISDHKARLRRPGEFLLCPLDSSHSMSSSRPLSVSVEAFTLAFDDLLHHGRHTMHVPGSGPGFYPISREITPARSQDGLPSGCINYLEEHNCHVFN